MGQSARLDCLAFDLLPHAQDFRPTPAVDVSGREVVQALVIASMIVMIDEVGDGAFEIARKEVVLEQDSAFERKRCADRTLTCQFAMPLA